MAGSANALQAAIHARLAGDATLTAMIGGDSVFDRRVSGVQRIVSQQGQIVAMQADAMQRRA